VYDVAEPLSSADTVGQPLHHCWAAQCSTGEAVFIDDIPPALGAGLQIKYSTHTHVDCTWSTMDCFLDDCDVGQRPSSGSADSVALIAGPCHAGAADGLLFSGCPFLV